MMLVDDGGLRLDDAVDRWLPELANRRVVKRIDAQLDDTIPRGGEPWVVPGRFGWDGGCGTTAYSDPKTDLVGILLTQRLMESPAGPAVFGKLDQVRV